MMDADKSAAPAFPILRVGTRIISGSADVSLPHARRTDVCTPALLRGGILLRLSGASVNLSSPANRSCPVWNRGFSRWWVAGWHRLKPRFQKGDPTATVGRTTE